MSFPMRTFLPLLLAGAAALVFWQWDDTERSQWVRDGHTLSLRGPIMQGDLARFQSVFDEDVTNVIVDSDGGDVDEALRIGMRLHQARVTVTVRGRCLSSCANYLFTAGAERIIDNGLVGFHGNAGALAAQHGGVESLFDGIPFWTAWFMSEERQREEVRTLRRTIRREKEFFAGLGIDQEIFTISQRPDKGKDNGQLYAFLLPTPSTFARYGIHNVRGTQSLALKASLEKEFSVHLLHE